MLVLLLLLLLFFKLEFVKRSWILLYLLVRTRAVIGQFSGPYSPVRPAKI